MKYSSLPCVLKSAPPTSQLNLCCAKNLHSLLEIISTTTANTIPKQFQVSAEGILIDITLRKVRLLFKLPNIKVLGKYCIPNTDTLEDAALKRFNDDFYEKYNIDKLSDYITDLINAWEVMLICLGAAFILGMLYLVILRCCAGVLIWTTIFAIIAITGGGGYWLYTHKDTYEESDNNYKYMQYGAYALWGLAGLFFLMMICCCNRIRLAVAIMKVTG